MPYKPISHLQFRKKLCVALTKKMANKIDGFSVLATQNTKIHFHVPITLQNLYMVCNYITRLHYYCPTCNNKFYCMDTKLYFVKQHESLQQAGLLKCYPVFLFILQFFPLTSPLPSSFKKIILNLMCYFTLNLPIFIYI